jgi:hypothetical protein
MLKIKARDIDNSHAIDLFIDEVTVHCKALVFGHQMFRGFLDADVGYYSDIVSRKLYILNY